MTDAADRYQPILSLITGGHFRSAEQKCRQMLHAASDPELIYILAVIKGRRKDYPSAAALFEEAVRHLPGRPDIFYNFGVICQAKGDLERAVTLWQRAVILNPALKDAHYNLGKAFSALKQTDQAESAYRQALALCPADAPTLYNLGNLKFQQYCFDEAEYLFRQAAGTNPSWSDPWVNLGMTLSRTGRFDDADRCFGNALKLDPQNAEAHWNRAITLLLNGNYQEGWKEYEWRFRRGKSKSIYPHRLKGRRWDGSGFCGKRLFIHSEQGFGDTIQFIRYLPQAKALGGDIIFEVREELYELLLEFPGVDKLTVMSADHPLEEAYDCYIPLMSLPGLFKTTLETIPDAVPYIFTSPEKQACWQKRLNSGKPKIGLVWAAKPTDENQKSCPLEIFQPMFDLRRIAFYSLQKGNAAAQLKITAPGVTNLGEDFETFADTAGAINCLDLVISVDTAVAHIAGAMGKPVWLLLPWAADWRWLTDRTDSPWYPTMRIFRQPRPGDWKGAVSLVNDSLGQWIEKNQQHIQ